MKYSTVSVWPQDCRPPSFAASVHLCVQSVVDNVPAEVAGRSTRASKRPHQANTGSQSTAQAGFKITSVGTHRSRAGASSLDEGDDAGGGALPPVKRQTTSKDTTRLERRCKLCDCQNRHFTWCGCNQSGTTTSHQFHRVTEGEVCSYNALLCRVTEHPYWQEEVIMRDALATPLQVAAEDDVCNNCWSTDKGFSRRYPRYWLTTKSNGEPKTGVVKWLHSERAKALRRHQGSTSNTGSCLCARG